MTLAVACTLLIAAAADLAPLQRELENSIPGCRIRVAFGSSGTLARQIEHGADFDVFLSASRKYTDGLLKVDAVGKDTVTPYAYGRIGLWSRNGVTWTGLQKAGRVAIANPAHAPYGVAARQALERQGLWRQVEPKIVYGENVRQAWRFAETGNADAAVVSWSLIFDKGGQLLPASWHDPIQQTAAIPVRAKNPDAARRFLSWLISPTGQTLLRSHGLMPVR